MLNGMLGIVTPEGFTDWIHRERALVKDFSRGMITAYTSAALATDNLEFFSYGQPSDTMAEVVATSGTAIAHKANDLDTNFTTKHQSPNAPCVYTRFGIQVEDTCLVSTAGSADDNLTDTHLRMLAARAYVEVFLGSTTDAYDKGMLPEFTLGREILTGRGWSTAALTSGGVDYVGSPGFKNDAFEGARPLPVPFEVVKTTTHVGARINAKQWGGLYISANLSLGFRAEFQGSRKVE